MGALVLPDRIDKLGHQARRLPQGIRVARHPRRLRKQKGELVMKQSFLLSVVLAALFACHIHAATITATVTGNPPVLTVTGFTGGGTVTLTWPAGVSVSQTDGETGLDGSTFLVGVLTTGTANVVVNDPLKRLRSGYSGSGVLLVANGKITIPGNSDSTLQFNAEPIDPAFQALSDAFTGKEGSTAQDLQNALNALATSLGQPATVGQTGGSNSASLKAAADALVAKLNGLQAAVNTLTGKTPATVQDILDYKAQYEALLLKYNAFQNAANVLTGKNPATPADLLAIQLLVDAFYPGSPPNTHTVNDVFVAYTNTKELLDAIQAALDKIGGHSGTTPAEIQAILDAISHHNNTTIIDIQNIVNNLTALVDPTGLGTGLLENGVLKLKFKDGSIKTVASGFPVGSKLLTSPKGGTQRIVIDISIPAAALPHLAMKLQFTNLIPAAISFVAPSAANVDVTQRYPRKLDALQKRPTLLKTKRGYTLTLQDQNGNALPPFYDFRIEYDNPAQ